MITSTYTSKCTGKSIMIIGSSQVDEEAHSAFTLAQEIRVIKLHVFKGDYMSVILTSTNSR